MRTEKRRYCRVLSSAPVHRPHPIPARPIRGRGGQSKKVRSVGTPPFTREMANGSDADLKQRAAHGPPPPAMSPTNEMAPQRHRRPRACVAASGYRWTADPEAAAQNG